MLRLEKATDAGAAQKARRAATELVLQAPLFGFTLLGEAIVVLEDPAIETMCTDGQHIWYSPAWVTEKPLASITFDLLHETLHIIYNHGRRRGEREPRLWNYACDIRVAHDCLKILKGSKLDSDHVPAFKWAADKSVEEIYKTLQVNPSQVPQSYQQDVKEPPNAGASPSAAEQEFRRKLTNSLAQATLAEAQRAGGKQDIADTYGPHIAARLHEIERCDVPWNELLHGSLAGAFGVDLARWVPPNRRYMPLVALPSYVGASEDHLLLGIDVSGSLSDEDMRRFRACIIPAASRARTTTIITFDQTIREDVTSRTAEEAFDSIKFTTGWHSYTSTLDLFRRADELRPTAIAIITDGHVILPKKTYDNVRWIVTPNGVDPPWGEIYRLTYSW